MADFEIKFDKLNGRVTGVEQKVGELTANVNNLVRELKDFKDEMRQQNKMRANELRDLQKRQDEERRKHEDDMRDINKKIDDKVDKISSQLQMMALTTILGVGAIVWAIVSAMK